MAQKNRGEMMKLVKKLKKDGLDVERTKSGHWKVTGSKGMTVLSFSPSASGLAQTRKQLRDIGYEGQVG